MHDQDETYYEVLRIPRSATVSEIVAAYHSAKAAFSKDSVAMYSLFSQDEADKVLSKLEEAYLTLSNIEKKREYDRKLAGGTPMEPVRVEVKSPKPQPVFEAISLSSPLKETDATDPNLTRPESITGLFLKNIRERRSLSVEDVSRITKIPLRFLVAIEEEDTTKLPAKVYIQGFIKNLSSLYKLDPIQTPRLYLSYIDTKKTIT